MAHPTDWTSWLQRRIDARKERDRLRSLDPVVPTDAVHIQRGDPPQSRILFSSNDYLGLSNHPRIIQRVEDALRTYGMGPRGSPLICGYTHLHQRLEQSIATWKGTDAALLCPTGFAANLAVMAALADEHTTIFSDALNHASIIDGCTLAKRRGASLTIYSHADADHLHRLLRDLPHGRRALVVTDSVFSMDGDLAPLPQIAEVCQHHGALLVIDGAHGSFVHGPRGAGLAAAWDLTDAVDLHVGTLSKGAGALGGFIATSHEIKSLLLNLGRSYIYSTAPPIPVVAAAQAAIALISDDDGPRTRLWSHIDRLQHTLETSLHSPIVPLILGPEDKALTAADLLAKRGLDVTAIRPPTVPEGTSRLRITLSAAHTDDDISRLIDAVEMLDHYLGVTLPEAASAPPPRHL